MTKLFDYFFYKSRNFLLSGSMEAFQVCIFALHHPVIDVSEPPRMGYCKG